MPIKKDKKSGIIQKFAKGSKDTGSPEVQVALLTERINQIVGHLKKNKKDNHSRRGLLILVGQRKSLLNYLERKDSARFSTLKASLGLK
ncbi:MAG: 30S ribosomal protein S15 [Candidatus Margulisiibacteriota bacterium]|nr:30S ribosomal protein S15 [Candidatus Margulisiibacteriota bacterium]